MFCCIMHVYLQSETVFQTQTTKSMYVCSIISIKSAYNSTYNYCICIVDKLYCVKFERMLINFLDTAVGLDPEKILLVFFSLNSLLRSSFLHCNCEMMMNLDPTILKKNEQKSRLEEYLRSICSLWTIVPQTQLRWIYDRWIIPF